jgi:hypothetical protein
VPSGYELKERPSGLLVGTGIGLFAAGTAVSVFWAALLRAPMALIPFGGATAVVYSQPPSTISGAGSAIVGGIAQAAGIGLFVAGFVFPRRWLEASPVTLAPTANGAMISGSF